MNVVNHIFGDLSRHENSIKSLIKHQNKLSNLVAIGFLATAVGLYSQSKRIDILTEEIKELKQEKGE